MKTSRRKFLAQAAGGGLGAAAGFALAARAAAPEQKLRVGIIGFTGHGNFGHGLDTMWLDVPEVEIAAVADRGATDLAAAKQRLKVDKAFSDYQQMLAEVRPELVAICSRYVDVHKEMALAAVAAGARGIYMEKPFCRTPAEADEIIAACKRRGVKLAVAHLRRLPSGAAGGRETDPRRSDRETAGGARPGQGGPPRRGARPVGARLARAEPAQALHRPAGRLLGRCCKAAGPPRTATCRRGPRA